ncbi:MAG TPA: 16S rRNA (adenine(1518)-N(6)/adenine(1519)-N(6))-dimethyltransferase RsmA [Methanomassiliicoccales archaeon]|nr:16S rRNA (adenine(1518)-N(6)/adenine(1519)-N(6))-dimethyltransferase RsmA [Methanomassiliicoccales archaeon]
MNPAEIKVLLERYDIRPTKAKGQNYLVDERVAEREVQHLHATDSDTVLEIGPGLGVLTERLVGRVGKVVCIELEDGACRYLSERFPGRIELIQADALKTEFPQFQKFISNLPYSISSPLLFKLLDYRFERGVVMVQREFADRMVAKAGSDDYSRLTVNTYYRAKCEVLEKVPRSAFWPQPDVDSSVVLIEPRPPPFPVENERFYLHLVNLLFQHRRKKIGTVLKMTGQATKERIPDLPFVDCRVEDLEPEQIAELSDDIGELGRSK